MANPKRENIFKLKRFNISNKSSAMKVGTDGVLLGAWCDIPAGEVCVADIGCGTGLIALMIAQRNEQAKVTAIEIDPAAAAEAKENVANSPFADRVEVVNRDATLPVANTELFDLIVCNPPFFNEDVRSSDSGRDIARREGCLTLETLFSLADERLTDDGEIAIVMPTARDTDVIFEASLKGFSPHIQCRVATVEGKPPKRTLWQFSRKSCECRDALLTIKDCDGNYGKEYLRLVTPFYTKL